MCHMANTYSIYLLLLACFLVVGGMSIVGVVLAIVVGLFDYGWEQMVLLGDS